MRSMDPFQYLEVWIQKGRVQAYEDPIAFHRQGHDQKEPFRTSIYRPNANKRNTPGEYEFIAPLFPKLAPSPAEVQNFCAIRARKRGSFSVISNGTREADEDIYSYPSITRREAGKSYTLVVQEAVILLRIEYLCQRTRRLSPPILSTQQHTKIYTN